VLPVASAVARGWCIFIHVGGILGGLARSRATGYDVGKRGHVKQLSTQRPRWRRRARCGPPRRGRTRRREASATSGGCCVGPGRAQPAASPPVWTNPDSDVACVESRSSTPDSPRSSERWRPCGRTSGRAPESALTDAGQNPPPTLPPRFSLGWPRRLRVEPRRDEGGLPPADEVADGARGRAQHIRTSTASVAESCLRTGSCAQQGGDVFACPGPRERARIRPGAALRSMSRSRR
jgi:hypothetical protein